MVKFIVLLVGIIFVVLGIWGIVVWRGDLLVVLKGGVPLFLAFVGVIMAIAAIGEIRDAIARKKEEEKEKEEEKKEEKKEEQKQE